MWRVSLDLSTLPLNKVEIGSSRLTSENLICPTQSETSNEFEIKSRVKQGRVLSPHVGLLDGYST